MTQTFLDWQQNTFDLFHTQYSDISEKRLEKALRQYLIRFIEEFLVHTMGEKNNLKLPNLYYFRLTQFNKNAVRVQHQGQRINLTKWIATHNPLFQIIERAHKYSKENSIIKLLYTVDEKYKITKNHLENYYHVCRENPALTWSPEEIEILERALYGVNYPHLQAANYEQVPINLSSLGAFIDNSIYNLAHSANKSDRYYAKLRKNIQDGTVIYLLAFINNHLLKQIPSETISPREYYKKPNLLNCSREVRHAALGECTEYDLDNSVYRWQLTFIDDIQRETGKKIQTKYTREYIDNKTVIRNKLQSLMNSTNLHMNTKEKMIKQAMTALSFGARTTHNSWFHNGAWHYSALRTILHKPIYDQFIEDSFVSAFIQEQNIIRKEIFEYVTQHRPELKKIHKRVNRSKVLVFLYHEFETKIINLVRENICDANKILLRVHDAVYTKGSINLNDYDDIAYHLGQRSQWIRFQKSQTHPKCVLIKQLGSRT